MRLGLTSLLVVAPLAALAIYACDGESDGLGGLCVAGDQIFCRCKGGDPGTKPCSPDGNSFGECAPCEDRESNGPAAQSNEESASTGGPGGGTPGDKPLFAKCMDDSECQSVTCRQNYCTKVCEKVSDCPYPQSECVKYESESVCMPACQTAVDCQPYDAPPSMCGYTQAVDAWDVTVCANWGSAHKVMPVDTDCVPFDHEACNLGYPNREIVCPQTGVCTKGCFTNDDCPTGKTCSAQGSLGNCQ